MGTLSIYGSTFYGDKRGVHQGFGSPQTQYQSVEHYFQLMEILPRTPYIHTEIVAANQLIIVQHPRATDIGWSTLSITTKYKHVLRTIWQRALFHVRGTRHPLTTNNSFARTSPQRAPTAIPLFPLSATLSLEQCASSCVVHAFPPRRAVGFIYHRYYVSTRNIIHYRWNNICTCVCYRCLPFRLATPPVSRYPHPEGEPCIIVYDDSFFSRGQGFGQEFFFVSASVWDSRN